MSEFALPTVLQVAVSLYGYFLPLMLYAAWSTLAFWDLGRRTELSRGAAYGWTAAVLLLPFVGALGYHLIGGSQVPAAVRRMAVGGGLAVFALSLLAARLLQAA